MRGDANSKYLPHNSTFLPQNNYTPINDDNRLFLPRNPGIIIITVTMSQTTYDLFLGKKFLLDLVEVFPKLPHPFGKENLYV